MSANHSNNLSNRTVLVAEDDRATRGLIRAALEPDFWTIKEAGDGLHACEVAERIQPDIVLLDVGMPRMDGFEACARLRTQPSTQHTPVMMMTAMDDQESISRAYEVGATDFLPKPFNFTILRQRLQYMRRAQQDRNALRNERDFASAVVEHSAALVLILDPAGHIVRFNESCERVSVHSQNEVEGRLVWDVLSGPDERGAFERLIAERGTNHYEGSWTINDGSQREIAWSNSVLLDSHDAIEHVVCTGLDITSRNQAEERARFLASYDPLTSLPNRRLITERVDRAIVATAAEQQLAVLLFDLDRFTDVNATLGYEAGDQLLKTVSDRLAKSLQLSNVLTRHNPDLRTELGRLGGDEFIVLATGVQEASEVAAIVERLQQALGRSLKWKDQELTMTASVGAALYPADGSDSESLLRNSESAMRAARNKMRGSYHFYSPDLHRSISKRLSLEQELRQAVERGEFVLHYQPKRFTGSGHISGAEALIRWQHPSQGLLSPGSFIDIAEETGLIVPIGEWVLRQACNQMMSWLESGLDPATVAVNLSSAQFHGTDLLKGVVEILNETTLPPSYLTLKRFS